MKQPLQDALAAALAAVQAEAGSDAPAPAIEITATRDPAHGDFASNLALVMAKPLRMAPRQLAEKLLARLPASGLIARAEIAGPGFINFFLADAARGQVVAQVLRDGAEYGHDRSGAKGRVMVEFVSANPTGPMHVGHGRGAAYGDALANILAAAGWQVAREYYINDAGRQVEILAVSVWLRYLQRLGEALPFPARAYPGDYLQTSVDALITAYGQRLRHAAGTVFEAIAPEPATPDDGDEAAKAEAKAAQERHLDALIRRAKTLLGDDWPGVQQTALDDQLARIRGTLETFGVRYDRWYSEAALVAAGGAAHALERLRESGRVYDKDGALWLRTADLGDEKDRVLIKADGAATYFANDLAYHVDKLERGFDRLIDVWGADHHGYVGRVRAAIEALTGRKDALAVQLLQFVTLSSGRMGKRSGNFVTFDELLRETGVDATRFFYLMRSHDQHLEFDIELARSQSNDNPVYYVQYAHARVASVFRQASERGLAFDAAAADLSRLSETEEQELIGLLQQYPEQVARAAEQCSPHLLANYLRALAAAFHGYYNRHQFLVDDAALRDARLALVAASGQVLRNGLGLLGVGAPESM